MVHNKSTDYKEGNLCLFSSLNQTILCSSNAKQITECIRDFDTTLVEEMTFYFL